MIDEHRAPDGRIWAPRATAERKADKPKRQAIDVINGAADREHGDQQSTSEDHSE